jgi:hypothetical protein
LVAEILVREEDLLNRAGEELFPELQYLSWVRWRNYMKQPETPLVENQTAATTTYDGRK